MSEPSNDMSTPRTDAFAESIHKYGIDWHHSAQKMADFAKALERENAKLIKEIAEAKSVNADFDKTVEEVARFKANDCSVEELVGLRAENETWVQASEQWSEIAKQKSCLEKQVMELREALSLARDMAEAYGKTHTITAIDAAFSFTASPELKKKWVKREALEKCEQALAVVIDEHERLNYIWKQGNEALAAARKELE